MPLLVFTKHSGINTALLHERCWSCSQTFYTRRMQGWESRLELCLSIFTGWSKNADLADRTLGGRGCVCLCVCLFAAEYFSWDIFEPLAFCIYHLSSECDCQSWCRQAAWQHNRDIQHVENPLLHVQLVLVFLFLSHCGAADSGGSHTSGGSEVWSGRVSFLLESLHLCSNLCEINKLSVGLNCLFSLCKIREGNSFTILLFLFLSSQCAPLGSAFSLPLFWSGNFRYTRG